METFCNKLEDITWLFSTHLKNYCIPEYNFPCCNSFIIVGNEDCPQTIKLYRKENPNYTTKPFATFILKKDADEYELV